MIPLTPRSSGGRTIAIMAVVLAVVALLLWIAGGAPG